MLTDMGLMGPAMASGRQGNTSLSATTNNIHIEQIHYVLLIL
jgi:hypothetical protein